jgi:hypothetical protein
MNMDTIFDRHTDFISNKQNLLIRGYNSQRIIDEYQTSIYSTPVRKALLSALKAISVSKIRLIKERQFTLFWGDFGSAFELFGVGIENNISSKIVDIFDVHFQSIKGFESFEYGSIPSAPLIPHYRYESGKIFQYTKEQELIGTKLIDDDEFGSLYKIEYRMYESAEGLGVKERYCCGK